MDRILPESLLKHDHIAALEQIIAEMFAGMDWGPAMIYMVDTVSEKALYFLADQFGILGYRGWKLATTTEQKRAAIKSAIELKRYMGSLWAIQQALIICGYGGATITEGVDTGDPDTDWARFQIEVDLGISGTLDAATPQELTRLINVYKNARSFLVAVSYNCNVNETLPLPAESVDFDYTVPLEDELFTGTFRYDGTYTYNGSQKYKPGIEDLQVTII